jgi:uncharacterized protein YuzE
MGLLVTVDTNSDVLSVDLKPGQVAETVEFDDSHLIDLAEDGSVLSIEILTPEDPKIEEIAEKYGLGDRVPEILSAIEAARAPKITTATVGSRFEIVQGSVRFSGGQFVGTRPAEVIPPARELTLR